MSTRSQATTTMLPSSTAGPSGGTFHKANVLAGVQDAYWSDDEADDIDCPLCLEEMDLSDKNFKPCPCGYQVCRFCWHHIKSNLNARCPACRRIYTEEAVEFKPVGREDQKRVAQQKRLKEKERKELDALGRRHLTNVRIVQRNMIYVTGIGPRFAKEELIPTLRSNDYFGQYGKITKILLVKRPPPANSPSKQPVVGLYINYYRREDAARAVVAVDGAPSPSGGGEVMRASHGTTKYCRNFLRGVACGSQGCLDLHDWGDERDCFTKEDLATLKHTMKDTEHRPRAEPGQTARRADETEQAPTLPRSASWARTGQNARPASPMNAGPPPGLQTQSRPQRQSGKGRDGQSRTASVQDSSRARSTAGPASSERRAPQPTSARVPVEMVQPPSTSDRKTRGPEPQQGSKPDAVVPSQPAVRSPPIVAASVPKPTSPTAQPSRPSGVPSSSSIGVPRSSVPEAAPTSSGIVASTSTYRLTNQAKALLDDVLHLRDSSASLQSPFPDFDRMLTNLRDGSFSFSLDLDSGGELARGETESQSGFEGWSTPASPESALSIKPMALPVAELETAARSGYSGSFNPFDGPEQREPVSALQEQASLPSTREQSPVDDDLRRSSRFGFARRFGTPNSTRLAIHSLSSSPRLSEGITSSSPGYPASIVSPPNHHQPLQPALQTTWSYSEPPQSTSQLGVSLSNQQHAMQAMPQAEPQYFKQYNPDAYAPQQEMNPMLPNMYATAGPSRHQDHPMQNMHAYNEQPFQDPTIMPMQLGGINGAVGDAYRQQEVPQMRDMPLPGPPPGLGGAAAPFSNGQQMSYTESPQSFQSPQSFRVGLAGTVASSHAAATSPSFNSAISLISGGSGDADTVSASGEGETGDIEDGMESGPISLNISLESSPVLSSADFPPLSATDFPSLPASQPADVPVRREIRRPVISTAILRSAEPKASPSVQINQRKAAPARKTPASLPKKPSPQPTTVPAVSDKLQVTDSVGPIVPAKAVDTPELRPPTSPIAPVRAASRVPARPAAHTPQPSVVPLRAPVQSTPFLSKKARKAKLMAKEQKSFREDSRDDSKDDPRDDVRDDSKDEVQPNEEPDASVTDEAAEAMSRGPTGPSLLPADVAPVDVTAPPYVDRPIDFPATLGSLLNEIGRYLDVESIGFFKTIAISGKAQTPIRYAPLVQALSTLSAGSGSFANNMPNGSIDTAVSSFQQLLETLTQTISDILHLLPRNTWDDSSSFDGVLRDMLKAEDLLDEMAEDAAGKGDEVVALTMALEKRARWMEVQLAKLEELHRDINTAAVRAVLSINDRGWDSIGFLPRQGDSLPNFDVLGQVEVDGENQYMTVDELEGSLEEARALEGVAESEVKHSIHRNRTHLWS